MLPLSPSSSLPPRRAPPLSPHHHHPPQQFYMSYHFPSATSKRRTLQPTILLLLAKFQDNPPPQPKIKIKESFDITMEYFRHGTLSEDWKKIKIHHEPATPPSYFAGMHWYHYQLKSISIEITYLGGGGTRERGGKRKQHSLIHTLGKNFWVTA